ncbi:MAG: cytosine deaminase [Cyanothece sp. SIO2G6]|nr:cytosine deaminase [Cyanothece sp. SIO2G6]
MIPTQSHYWLKNAHIPQPLLEPTVQPTDSAAGPSPIQTTPLQSVKGDGLVLMDVEIEQGMIRQVIPAGSAISSHPAPSSEIPNPEIPNPEIPNPEIPMVDLQHKQVWPCFVDMHTHLDKGHTWEREPNPDRTFLGAIGACDRDMTRWTPDDLYLRMEFGLKCSYAHGTVAVRTHLDAPRSQATVSFGVFKALQAEWRDRLTLQATCLVLLEDFLGSHGEQLANLMADTPGGILGAVAFPNDDLDTQLDRIFALAKERQLDLDFHVDESGDPHADSLAHIARAALRHQFTGTITCGHCCSLAVQPPSQVQTTLDLVKAANLGIVSLPLCNLYLQDRQQAASGSFLQTGLAVQEKLITGNTPRWRGVTLLHELKAAGIRVAIANDNCRDPFHGFGDHDMLEVFNLSARIAHLDHPYSQWVETVTATPAELMGLSTKGKIGPGRPADLVIFKARTFSELLSRSQHDRVVVRNGEAIATDLPAYEELDPLMHRQTSTL